ncbi:hypothetical protein ACGFY9_14065 [Streptomyces sp. NPDC048504]|uniref:hypothetical protein n=1 Tax=Streptomyces sp. NPDC048504 TaxID=3365559 RepID=UPI0037247821
MPDRLDPNPHSPYATAAPDVRHLLPGFCGKPSPGQLAPTGCNRLAVVPAEGLRTVGDDGDTFPAGICDTCIAAWYASHRGKELPDGRVATDCTECGSATLHGEWCALCRQEKHEAWWPLAPLVAAGCTTWEVTERSISRVDHDIDQLGVYAKGYWEWDDTGKKTIVVGLRVGAGEDRVVARFGDWLIRHPDGTFTVHAAPAAAAGE